MADCPILSNRCSSMSFSFEALDEEVDEEVLLPMPLILLPMPLLPLLLLLLPLLPLCGVCEGGGTSCVLTGV